MTRARLTSNLTAFGSQIQLHQAIKLTMGKTNQSNLQRTGKNKQNLRRWATEDEALDCVHCLELLFNELVQLVEVLLKVSP